MESGSREREGGGAADACQRIRKEGRVSGERDGGVGEAKLTSGSAAAKGGEEMVRDEGGTRKGREERRWKAE